MNQLQEVNKNKEIVTIHYNKKSIEKLISDWMVTNYILYSKDYKEFKGIR